MLAVLDMKLEEKIAGIKRTQELEITNLKRMMLAQIDTNLPRQMEPQSRQEGAPSSRSNQEERKLSYNPIRGPRSNQKVPHLNFNNAGQQAA